MVYSRNATLYYVKKSRANRSISEKRCSIQRPNNGVKIKNMAKSLCHKDPRRFSEDLRDAIP